MKKPDEISSWNFAECALDRNDQAIRFSETKAGLLLTINGLVLGLFANNIMILKELLNSKIANIHNLTFYSIIAITVGLLIVIVASLSAVFPRLHVTNCTSYLYFGHLCQISEKETFEKLRSSNSETRMTQIVSQIHATASIAHRKYILIRLAIMGTSLVFIGSVLIIGLQFFI